MIWEAGKIKQFPETQCCHDVRADGNKYIVGFQHLEPHKVLGTTNGKKKA